jgi:ABC-type sugar transport system substrate-binding protein
MDYAAPGALRAFEESGRSDMCLAVSHGGGPEARRKLRLSNSRLGMREFRISQI